MPTQHGMLAARDGWIIILVSSAFGFAFGISAVMWARNPTRSYYSRYGFEFSTSILRGRVFEPRSPPRGLPALPQAVLSSLLSAAAIFVLLFGRNGLGFLNDRLLFSIAWLACASSTIAWLMKASVFYREAEAQRSAQLQEFLSNAVAPVPMSAEKPPNTLTLWNRANVALFATLMLVVVVQVWQGT